MVLGAQVDPGARSLLVMLPPDYKWAPLEFEEQKKLLSEHPAPKGSHSNGSLFNGRFNYFPKTHGIEAPSVLLPQLWVADRGAYKSYRDRLKTIVMSLYVRLEGSITCVDSDGRTALEERASDGSVKTGEPISIGSKTFLIGRSRSKSQATQSPVQALLDLFDPDKPGSEPEKGNEPDFFVAPVRISRQQEGYEGPIRIFSSRLLSGHMLGLLLADTELVGYQHGCVLASMLDGLRIVTQGKDITVHAKKNMTRSLEGLVRAEARLALRSY